jgi:diguanylate cyclase (GGDEF)-like protein
VAPTPLAERTRDRLLALLADDRPDADRLTARLREIRSLDDVAAFSSALTLLVHLDVGEAEAEKLMQDVLRHRTEMQRALRRDPGLRVAAVDYLSNVERRLTNPKIVELSLFEQTERSAVTDPLTGLFNRRFFGTAMEREVRRSRRYRLSFSLVLLDLDHFKQVNDAYGHLFGDVVLQRAARIVRQSIREADVGCRYGGEEFAVILPETDRLGARAVGERIRGRIEESFASHPIRGRDVPLTISGGIACHPEDGQTTESLLARADEALYLAKGSGRNRVALHHVERRLSARFPVTSPVSARLLRVEAGAQARAHAVNLSLGGVLVETEASFRPPDPVRVLLEGEPAEAGAGWEIDGRVVRVERGSGSTGAFRVGIAFARPVPMDCLRACVGDAVLASAGPGGRS